MIAALMPGDHYRSDLIDIIGVLLSLRLESSSENCQIDEQMFAIVRSGDT